MRLVYLKGDYDLIAGRMGRREGHFMPPALLKSQFEALEPPTGEAGVLRVDARAPLAQLLNEVGAWLRVAVPA